VTTDRRRGDTIRAQTTARFDEYARAWVATCPGRTSRGLRDETREEYRKVLERHAIPYFRRQRLAEIEPVDVKRFIENIGRGRGWNTVRLALAPVRAMLADAAELGDIRSNPARGVRIGSSVRGEDDQRVKALKPDELRQLIAATPDAHRLFVRFTAETGMRLSEVSATRWCDVEFGRRRVRVERRVRDGVVGPPKSRAGRRSIPLTPEMTQILWEQRKQTQTAADESLVFPNRAGGYRDATNIGRWFNKAAIDAGVEGHTFHGLRHTCITNLLNRGLTVKQAQVWAGHASPTITLSVYQHLISDDLPESPFGGDTLGTKPTEASRNAADDASAETADLRVIPA
jgi:integrase